MEAITALATRGMPFTCNGLLKIVYLQWFTCYANFHSMERVIISTRNIKAHEIPSLMVKTV